MKLCIEVDTGIAAYIDRVKQEYHLENAEEAVRYLCNFHQDLKETEFDR